MDFGCRTSQSYPIARRDFQQGRPKPEARSDLHVLNSRTPFSRLAVRLETGRTW